MILLQIAYFHFQYDIKFNLIFNKKMKSKEKYFQKTYILTNPYSSLFPYLLKFYIFGMTNIIYIGKNFI